MTPRFALVGLAVLAIGTPVRAADAPLREDRIRFVVHDLVAGQLNATDLGSYLDTVADLLHGSQNTGIDIPTCTDFGTVTDGGEPPVLFTSNGGLAASLAIIDNEAELDAVLAWAATQGNRVGVFVQSINWCGAPLSNIAGCAPVPGGAFVVATDFSASLRPVVIAHERGHNAGLSHRTSDACALMNGIVATSHGCLDQTEATAFHNQADISTGDSCQCIDLVTMGPNKTWSLNPQGTSCDDGDLCTQGTVCDVGLCVSGTPVDCDDGAFCNGAETCTSGQGCQPGQPPPLDDAVACTDDSCDEVTDMIVHTPNHATCQNGEFCDGAEICDPSLDCLPGAAPPLDDGVACTDDSCDEGADVVVHAPNAAFCDDADPCTADSCDEVSDCANDPIPFCNAEVPALSRGGRGLLAALLIGAAALLSKRHRRR